MNMQVTLADLIKALEAEIKEDTAALGEKSPDVFLQAKIDQLAVYVATAAKAEAEKSLKPKEVRMTKRSRVGTSRAIPLKAPPEPTRTAEVTTPQPGTPAESVVVEPAKVDDGILPPPYTGERLLNVKHELTGRITGRAVTWEEAVKLHREGRLYGPKKRE